MRAPRPWTFEEDQVLLSAIACQGQEQINWLHVATFLPDRNNKDCRKRWVYTLSPTIKKGAWDEQEDTALREGFQQHGTKWSEVARFVGTRQPDQCSRRWHEAIKPNINRERWSLYEDEMLKNAVKAHGRRWIEIVERYFPERTPIATRSRYNQLLRRTNRTGSSNQERTPENNEFDEPDETTLFHDDSSCWSEIPGWDETGESLLFGVDPGKIVAT